MKWKVLQAFDFLKTDDMILRVQQIDFMAKKYGSFAGIVKVLESDQIGLAVLLVFLWFLGCFCFFKALLRRF